jgi:hypothetical protein
MRLLSSVATTDQSPPRRPVLVSGSSIPGTVSSRNEADRSDSKNDSRISSARTTIRNLPYVNGMREEKNGRAHVARFR